MAAHDAGVGHAGDAGGLDVFFPPLDHGRAAHRAGVLHPTGEGDGQNQNPEGQGVMGIGKQGAAHASNQQGDQDGREGEHDIAHPHQKGIEPAPHEARQQPQGHADQHRQSDRGQADRQRNARAVHQGGQNIAALVVGSEPKIRIAAFLPCRGQPCVGEFKRGQVKGVVRRNPRRKCRTEHANEGQHRCRHRHR